MTDKATVTIDLGKELEEHIEAIRKEAFEAGFAATANGFNGEWGANKSDISSEFDKWVSDD